MLDAYPCPNCEDGHVHTPTLTSTANKLIKMLKKEGFTIQRYDAYSTNSIYLKLDFGVCNSIRISDHKGKDGLSYKYNLLSIVKSYRLERIKPTSERNFELERHYYPLDAATKLVSDIIKHKKQKMINMSEPAYRLQMRKMLIKNRDNDGFWSGSIIV